MKITIEQPDIAVADGELPYTTVEIEYSGFCYSFKTAALAEAVLEAATPPIRSPHAPFHISAVPSEMHFGLSMRAVVHGDVTRLSLPRPKGDR